MIIVCLFSMSLLAGPACQHAPEATEATAPMKAVEDAGLKRPRHVAMAIPDGAGVALAGVIQWDGRVDGVLRLDVVTLAAGKPPDLVHQSTLEAPGPFELLLPGDFGEVHLVAYLDRNDNGPSPGEPVASRTIQVGDTGISGLALVLDEDANLGRLAPGAPPPADAGPPPEDNSGIVAGSSQAAAGN